MFKNLSAGLIFVAALITSPISMATLIASFDAGTELSISSSFASSEFESFFDDDFLDIMGLASGSVSGSGDGSSTLSAEELVMLSAFADGSVTGTPGSVEGFYLSSGELIIENTGGETLAGEVFFDISMVAAIFTETGDEWSNAFSMLVIGFEIYDDLGELVDEDILFDEFIEFDSSFEGTGDFSDSIIDSLTEEVSLDSGESIIYYFELDASGFADTVREPSLTIPEPSILVLFSLTIMALVARRYKK
ncbi:MAG: PEP-CTERM sorting domain-containing protein [Colwellia sp.]|uniref:PEP-CTERM sorting domain-containing protein n=1 Tax=Colwellia sp. TaxID=56799 RepID=UPI001DFCB0AF|nr:PEP-CTERM sorting domain-containing protein [Colwellia sp.]NQY49341.1 PEP-CTERM sorting domain-containing protein [Colwellia sp.]